MLVSILTVAFACGILTATTMALAFLWMRKRLREAHQAHYATLIALDKARNAQNSAEEELADRRQDITLWMAPRTDGTATQPDHEALRASQTA